MICCAFYWPATAWDPGSFLFLSKHLIYWLLSINQVINPFSTTVTENLSKINQPTPALNKQRGLHLDLNFLDSFIIYSCLCAGHSLLPQCQSQHVFLCYPPTISRSSHTGLLLEQTQANWLYPLLWSSEVWQTHRWGRISLSICMSRSHEASHGAGLRGCVWGGGGVLCGTAQTEGGQVIVPSGRWGWAQELIGSLGFDAERWWQVCVARPSEPRLHIHCVAGHRGNCHSSPSRRDRKQREGHWGEEREKYQFLYSQLTFSCSKDLPQSLFTSISSYRGVQHWHLVSHDCGLFTCLVRRESCDLFQSQLVSGRGGALGPARGSTEAWRWGDSAKPWP